MCSFLITNPNLYNILVLETFAKYFCMCKTLKQMCYNMQSPQHLLYKLYKAVVLTEIKGYAMIQFSYILLSQYNKCTWYLCLSSNIRPTAFSMLRDLHRAIKTNLFFASLNERHLYIIN